MASKGDTRVLFAMNLLLSALFSTMVVTGLSIVSLLEFSWRTVVFATTVLMLVTWIVVLR